VAALELAPALSEVTAVGALSAHATSTAGIRNVRFTSILLKNSNFSLDHNSEDR
jgi:hypothetical protein